MWALLLIRHLSTTCATSLTTYGFSLNSVILSTTPVLSPSVSTRRIVHFTKGCISVRMLSMEDCETWEVMLKKNLDPLLSSDSTQIRCQKRIVCRE